MTPPEGPVLCQLLLQVRAGIGSHAGNTAVGSAFQLRQGLLDAYPNNLLTFLLYKRTPVVLGQQYFPDSLGST